MSAPSLTVAETALDYVARYGLPVFPAKLVRRADGKFDKKPCITDWPNAASTDPRQIEQWQWSNRLIGTPTGKRSGLIVLDIDTKRCEANGWDTLENRYALSVLPETPIAHTVSGGVHVYFADRADIEIRNSEGEKGLGPGLDVRGEGGFIVLPSPGSGYTWDPVHNLGTVPLMLAPMGLRHRQQRGSRAGRGHFTGSPDAILDATVTNIARTGAGSRHDAIITGVFTVAGLVGAGRLPESVARARLSAAIVGLIQRTGGDLRKAEADFADAWKAGLRKPLRLNWKAGR